MHKKDVAKHTMMFLFISSSLDKNKLRRNVPPLYIGRIVANLFA